VDLFVFIPSGCKALSDIFSADHLTRMALYSLIVLMCC